MFWDFHVNNQESIHALMFLFGDRGLPTSVRHVNAYTGNTYKLTKADGTYHYARVHFLTNQGIEYLSNSEGAQLAGTHPDKHILDLQEAINSGNYPSWNLCLQTIHPSEISKASVDIFDMTKVWPHKQYPLRKVGRMVLDRNPSNWFAEIEQAAFSPSNMVRGIEPSPDPMLQARMFAYPDAARYRLGINYQFLPTNAAKSKVYCPTERDGKMNFTNNYEGDPNYAGTKIKPVSFIASDLKPAPGTSASGNAVHTLDRADTGIPVSFASEVTDKDFEQATALWQVMGKQEGSQDRLVNNAAAHISGVKAKWIRDEAYGNSFST
jgi:catalase